MTIPINSSTLADGATAASGSISVSTCQDFAVHRFFITLGTGWSGSADVQVQGSADGSTWADLLASPLNAVGTHLVEVERPFKFLQLVWAGNAGGKAITCKLEQFHSKQLGNGF